MRPYTVMRTLCRHNRLRANGQQTKIASGAPRSTPDAGDGSDQEGGVGESAGTGPEDHSTRTLFGHEDVEVESATSVEDSGLKCAPSIGKDEDDRGEEEKEEEKRDGGQSSGKMGQSSPTIARSTVENNVTKAPPRLLRMCSQEATYKALHRGNNARANYPLLTRIPTSMRNMPPHRHRIVQAVSTSTDPPASCSRFASSTVREKGCST